MIENEKGAYGMESIAIKGHTYETRIFDGIIVEYGGAEICWLTIDGELAIEGMGYPEIMSNSIEDIICLDNALTNADFEWPNDPESTEAAINLMTAIAEKDLEPKPGKTLLKLVRTESGYSLCADGREAFVGGEEIFAHTLFDLMEAVNAL